ncbi:replicative DNA helicase [Streptosporangium canum]|uniref:replicative DNA helicase n=1 Tax=Streptosporangium canum TaxID=324952 RepID=UPI00369C6A0F
MTTSDLFEDLPSNLEAEAAVLGAAMMSADAAADVVESLTTRDFRSAIHRIIFDTITSLTKRGIAIDSFSVKDDLERHDLIGKIQGAGTLAGIIAQVPTSTNVGYWIKRVREVADVGHGIMAGREIMTIFRNESLDLDERVDAARKALDDATRVSESATARPVSELIMPFLDRLESKTELPGVTTGWIDMDALLTKIRPGQLITVGARPGMGKTVFLMNLALHVGLTLGQPVLFASLEMSSDEILIRMVACRARVPLNNLQRRDLTDEEWSRIAQASSDLAAAEHLYIDDSAATTINHLRAKLRSMRRSGHAAAVCCLDYMQLMTSPKKIENRQQEVSEISRSLKLLSKELEVPIVVGSQLNRGPEQRTDKRPLLADLRESGSVEQDSDVVILLHREDAYDRESPRAGEADFIVAKHRQGATATISVAFQGHYSRFVDMAPNPPYIPPTSSWGRDAQAGD